MTRPAKRAFVREYFDRNVQEWDTLRYQDETYRSRARIALSWLRTRSRGRVLDLGCGTGRQTIEAVRQGHAVTSVDFSIEMARATRDRLVKEAPNAPLRVVVADALHLPFRPGAFDAVVALGLIGFVPDRPALVEGIRTLVAPGGELIADVGVPEDQVLLQRWSARLGRMAAPFVRLVHRVGLLGSDGLPAGTPGFYSAAFVKHRPAEFERLLRDGGFLPRARGGAGFGDLRLLGRGIVPWRLQTLATRFLGALSRRPGGGWLARNALIYLVRASRASAPVGGIGPTPLRAASSPGLLFVANFAGDTGYAWTTIEKVFRGIADRLSPAGVRTFIAYPARPGLGTGDDPALTAVSFDYTTTRTARGLIRFLRILRERRIQVLYLTDLETWSWRYPLVRLAGVRSIVLHDRTSGDRNPRSAAALWAKKLLHRMPYLSADRMVGVSDFVARRLVRVNGAPPERVIRVHNGIEVARFDGAAVIPLHRLLGLSRDTDVVFCSGRAQPYKGVQVLIEAARRLTAHPGHRRLAFVYCGDGPALSDLRREAQEAGLSNFHFLGARRDVPDLLRSASIAVIPSLWAEAFGLTVVEAMAAGVPVVATRVGGIPELVDDGVTGLLVPPDDATALEGALIRLLDDPSLRAALAAAGRARARSYFGIERTIEELAWVVTGELAGRAVATEDGEGARPRTRVPRRVIRSPA